MLDAGITNYPDKTAIRFDGRKISYLHLGQLCRKLATGFLDDNITAGDRVALFLPNCPEAVMVFLACYRIGAIAVPLNYRYLTEEARYVIEQTGAKLIIFHQTRSEIVHSLRDLFDPTGMYVLNDLSSETQYRNSNSLFDYPELSESITVKENHPALILYTSGSTGRPKGVAHSHQGVYSAMEISRQALDFNAQDIVLVGKPISHAGGLQTQLMPTLSVGGEVVLDMKPSPAKAVSLIKQNAVTEYGMLASDLLDFIEYLEENPTTLPSLKNSIGSGDTVPMELHHRFRDLLGWEVLEGCGMTEVGGYYSMNPRYGKRRWGSMGVACPETKIRIISDQGEDVGEGETGEIIVQTPSATIGYWNDEHATQQLFRDDWLLTGDLAHFGEQRYLWFVGRKKLMIVRRGSNIAPAEVENVIDGHPQVHASVVVGIPDQHDGHVPVACIAVLKEAETLTAEQVHAYISAKLAAYKTPAYYLFLPELPRNSTGKFDRHRLEQIATKTFVEKH